MLGCARLLEVLLADPGLKTPGNAPGRYYVDETCIASKFCCAVAEKNIRMGDNFAYVHRQPETPEEVEACREAINGCPVSAIGDDGDA